MVFLSFRSKTSVVKEDLTEFADSCLFSAQFAINSVSLEIQSRGSALVFRP